jgi:hypothetical protein
MRIVVRDENRAMSFLMDADVVPALVAACSTEPRTVESLLLATEFYRPGITQQVMNELFHLDLWMEGDTTKVRQLHGTEGAERSGPEAFEIVDPATRRLASLPDSDGLVIIDLEHREISSGGSTVDLPGRRGLVVAPDPTGEYEMATAYTLGHTWRLGDPEEYPVAVPVHA